MFYCNTCVGKMYLDQIELKEYQVPDTAEWKMLFLIFKNSKIPMKDSTGQDIIGQNGVSEKEIEDIKKAVLQFKEDSYKDSNGKLNAILYYHHYKLKVLSLSSHDCPLR